MGKSTVAVNLAYQLAVQGGRVGLLDLDLYGPSLPILVQPEDAVIRRSPLGPGAVYPIEYGNVKLLSLGFVNTHVSANVGFCGPWRPELYIVNNLVCTYLTIHNRAVFQEVDKTAEPPL